MLPAAPDTVRLYLAAAATEGIPNLDGTQGKPQGYSSIMVLLSAITFVHDQAFPNTPNPGRVPKTTLDGIRRTIGTPPKKKAWISIEQVSAMVRAIPNTLRGIRDRAVILCAFASGGRRRSEIVSMQVGDLQATSDGSILWVLPRSKTDQLGEGHTLLIPQIEGSWESCPARTLNLWLRRSQITEGAVFRHIDRHGNLHDGLQAAAVNDIVKRAVESIGLDPNLYGAHSLRSGFATSMARKGVRLEDIMERTGHKSVDVAQGYVRAGRLLSDDDPVRNALK